MTKMILIFVNALALTSASLVYGQGNDSRLDTALMRAADEATGGNRNGNVQDADDLRTAPEQGPEQAMSVAYTTTRTDTSPTHNQTRDVSHGRYERTHEHSSLEVFAQHGQHPYRGQQDLEGLGHARFGDIKNRVPGHRTAVWNQHATYAEYDILSDDAWVWYNTANFEVKYLDGCTVNGGKSYHNMICFVEEAPAPVAEKECHHNIVIRHHTIIQYHECVPQRVYCPERPVAYRPPCQPFYGYAGGNMAYGNSSGYNGGGNFLSNILNGAVLNIGNRTTINSNNRINSGNSYVANSSYNRGGQPMGGQMRPPGVDSTRSAWSSLIG